MRPPALAALLPARRSPLFVAWPRRQRQHGPPSCATTTSLPQHRSFGWTPDDTDISFKVKADGVSIKKLAGGMMLRADQGLLTTLEVMGSRSVYNGVKAFVLANRYFEARRVAAEEDGADPQLKESKVVRLGFVPFFARKDENQWMRLQVVTLETFSHSEIGDADVLRVSRNSELRALGGAITASWNKHITGSGAPWIGAMGTDTVSNAVKGVANALKDLRRRKEGVPSFVCVPRMEDQENLVDAPGSKHQTVTYLTLEQRSTGSYKREPPTWARGKNSSGKYEKVDL